MNREPGHRGWRRALPTATVAAIRAGDRATIDHLAQAVLSHQNGAAALFWLAGAAAVAVSVPLVSWPRPSGIILLCVAGIAAVFGGGRALLGVRSSGWTLQVNVAVGNLLVTVAVAVAIRGHVDIANIYLLTATFAILYLPPRTAILQVGASALAYAAVLLAVRGLSGTSAMDWLSVFGSVAILGAVLLSLVAMLRTAALGDALTGLPNRRSWDERLGHEMERSRRTGQALSVMMIDLDDFKYVNDRQGHESGDRLLRSAASAWQAAIRGGGDFLARLGGDEFGILTPGLDGDNVHQLGRRISCALPADMSASWGAATWDGSESATELLERADRSMYEAKRRRERVEDGAVPPTATSPRAGDPDPAGPENGDRPGRCAGGAGRPSLAGGPGAPAQSRQHS